MTRRFEQLLAAFGRDESGATAIEYGFIALLIGVGIIGSIKTVAPAINTIFTNVVANVN